MNKLLALLLFFIALFSPVLTAKGQQTLTQKAKAVIAKTAGKIKKAVE